MNKYLIRLLFILIGGGLFWLCTLGRLTDFPVFNILGYVLWGLVVILGIIGIGKKRHWWAFLLALMLFQMPLATMAEEAEVTFDSSTYTSYCQQYLQAKKNNWSGDKACDATQRENARKYTAKNKGTVSKLTSECSCSDAYDCATKYMSLCDNYDSRHRSENKDNKETHTVNELLQKDDSGCWPCQMATVVFVVVQNLSDTLYSAMLDVAVRLLSLIFLGWIMYKGLTAVVFVGSEGMTFASQVLIRFIGVSLTTILLTSNGMKTLYVGLLNPFMDMGISVAQLINDGNEISSSFSDSFSSGSSETDYCSLVTTSSTSTSSGSTQKAKLGSNFRFATSTSSGNMDVTFADIDMDTSSAGWESMVSGLLGGTSYSSSLAKDTPTLLNDNMKAKLLCMTQKFYKQTRPFIALGQSLVEFGNYDSWTLPMIPTRFPNLKLWITGWIFICIFTVFSFLVAFKMMDVFLKLAFFLVMMPLFVASIAFPAFRDFAKKGWSFLVHSLLEFVGLALAITFIMQMFESSLETSSTSLKTAMTASYSDDYGKNLFEAVYGAGTCWVLFMMVAICYFGFCMFQKVTPILDSIFGTSGIGGSLMGGMALAKAQAVVNLAQKAGQAANNKNVRYKEPGAEKKAEVKKLKGEAKEAQKKADKKQSQADKDKNKAKELKEKAEKPGASEEDKKKSAQADKKAESSQKEADLAKIKAQEAQNKLEQARKELSNARFENSTATFKPRQYAENAAKGLHYGSQWAADKIEGIGLGIGQTLNKTGIGSVLGVPIVAGTKAVSWGMRGATKTASVVVHAATATPGAVKDATKTTVKAAKFTGVLAKNVYKNFKK